MTAAPYQPRGGALDLLYARDPEVLLSGPAGTGKTVACLTKLFLVCAKYPGARCLVVRKTRESLTEAALVSWESKVVPEGHPVLLGPQRRMRQAYQFANGSEVVVGGLDKAQKVMSTEYDVIYVQEAIEVTEDDWESLTTRLRNGRVPYQQVIADTNPSHPRHWLKVRCDAGRCRLVESRHEDNPTIIDPRTGGPTPAGAVYLSKLDALTGPRKLRLRHGRWAQAEGVVYDGWDAAVHLCDPFPIPFGWTRYLSIDFGFTNPFVCQWWAEDHDGRLWLYRELYRTKTLVEDAAKTIKGFLAADEEALAAVLAADLGGRLSRGEVSPAAAAKERDGLARAARAAVRPRAVVCDHDAEDRATLERHLGLGTTPARKAVSPGLQAVAARLCRAADGKPRLRVMRGALVDRDADLEAAKRPCGAAEEFDGYSWPKGGDGKPVKEVPVKDDDHSMDALRYMVMHLDAARPVPGVR